MSIMERRRCQRLPAHQPDPGLRILVVYKKTHLTTVREKKDKRVLRLIRLGHESVASIVQAHAEHTATLETIQTELQAHGLRFRVVRRERMRWELRNHDWDLVITVGGDGTVLEAVRYIRDGVPILGVNSAVSSSLGHYCAANMTSFKEVLEQIISGKRKPLRLMRLQVWLDNKLLPERALNEVWVTNKNKGDTARYTLYINKRKCPQKSDGLLIGTAGGSSGWMRSYGAKVLPITSRRFGYTVQGLIVQRPEDCSFRTGMLRKSDMVRVVSTTSDGMLQVDGRHVTYPFPRGSELIVKPSRSDALVFGDPHVNDKYLKPASQRSHARSQPASTEQQAEFEEYRLRWASMND